MTKLFGFVIPTVLPLTPMALKAFTFKAEDNIKEQADQVLTNKETFSSWVRDLVLKEIAKRKRAAAK